MKRSLFIRLGLGMLILIGCVPRTATPSPAITPTGITITGFIPDRGLPGTIIELQGSGFDTIPSNNIVTIGGSTGRVISGDANHLRVVALRDLTTGTITVQAGSNTVTSLQEFRREGSTTRATPLQDSDSELIVGQGFDFDQRYDMSAQGLGQKILVVLTTPSDINPEDLAPAGQTASESVNDRLASANLYWNHASYNLVSAAFTVTPNWIPLSQIHDFYCWQQDDIDRAQSALDAILLDPSATAEQIQAAKDKLNAATNAQGLLQEPDFLFAEALIGAKAAMPDFDTYTDYFIILAGPDLRGQNFGTQTGYHAESSNPSLSIGSFDIDFAGPKGITYVAQTADWGRMVHELSHFFAMGDIYAESFADGGYIEGSAAPFAMMGNHDQHPLYIGYDIEKNLNYFNESLPGGNVVFLEWGSVADKDETYDLVAHSKTQDPAGNSDRHLLRLKVTDGLLYYVEVRQKPDVTFGAEGDYSFDTDIPLVPSNPAWQAGVIIYKAVENNNQSNNNERYVSLLPPARVLQAGESFEDPARTIRISVTQKLADRPAKYRVRVEWGHLPAADPNGQFDLRITPWGAPPWETVDIWANSLKNDETSLAKIIYKNHEPGDDTQPIGNGDPPWVGHDNTLFARITNQGSVQTSESVKVSFYVNTPPGVGDNGTWAPFDTIDVGVLAPGETRIVEASRKWRPAAGEHTCVKVAIHSQTGEITFDNNQAQENFSEFETGAASPYAPVEFDFLARNPYDTPVVMDLQARGVPADWFVAFDHGSVWLAPNSEKQVHVLIWTDRVAEWSEGEKDESPRKPLINIEGWMDRFGDRVFPVGGITTFVQAVRTVKISIEPLEIEKIGEGQWQGRAGESFLISIQVTPSTGVTPIAVHITDPDGNLITERTETDSSGQLNYQTRYVADKAAEYTVQAFVLGGTLAGEAESEVHTIIIP